MFHTKTLTAVALGTALTAFLPAQTTAQTAANRFIPDNSSLVIRIASPAKWRQQFGTTQAAKLMQANSLAPFLAMASQRIDMGLEMLRDSGMFDADLADGLLNKWQGDIIISAQIDWDGFADAMDYGEVPPMSFVVALTPDGSFDLAAVAKELESLTEKTDPEREMLDLTVGDMNLRCTDYGGDAPDMIQPVMIDGHLVMIGSMQLEKDAAKLISSNDRLAMKTDGAAFFVHADLSKLIATAMDAGSDGGPVDTAAMMDMMGLGALEDMTMLLKPDGAAIVGEMRIGLKTQNRGIFGILSKSTQQPKLLQSVPATCESFSVTTLDLGAAYTTIADVWTSMEDFAPLSLDDALGVFANATKVRFKEDLLDHIGKELMVVQDLEALADLDLSDMEDDPTAMFAGSVYGLALSDGQAFAASLEKVLRSRGMHVGRKTEDYATVKVHRLKLAGMIDLEYVVTDDLLLIALGDHDGTRRALRNVLDTRAADTAELPEIVAKRASSFRAGWNGIAVTSVGSFLEGMIMGIEASGQFGPGMQMASQIVKGVVGDMKRIGIDTIVSTSYCDDNGITSHFRW